MVIGTVSCGIGRGREAIGDPGEPVPGLSEEARGRFLFGKAVFDRLTTPEEGLGPLYNETRCFGCHAVPTSGGSGEALVLKATRFANGQCDLLVDEGGDNIQQRATAALIEHGVTSELIPARATDSTRVTGPSLYGLGLIEAIPESSIIARADPDDIDGDGISGRPGRTVGGRMGRFGRKGEAATILEFVETALRFELGLTTPDNPEEETPNGRPLPSGVDPMPEPEIDERGMRLLSDYIRFLAAPSPEPPEGTADEERVDRGARVFDEIGCSACHVPSMRTGEHAEQALSRRVVRAYSDLLLHDLGPGLADVCGVYALPSEYRTPRLWGLRFRSQLLHDGRAANPREAILYHGGEGDSARAGFVALSAQDQEALLRFLQSL